MTLTRLFAESLPLKFYTSADGLANDEVNRIVPDSQGFLWICTEEGLSRFDGYKFKNYTQEQGLPHRSIYDLLETKSGDYLLATNGGLVVFNPLGKAYRWNIFEGKLEQNSDEPPMFKTYLTPEAARDKNLYKGIFSLTSDANGTVYVGTNHGLFKFIKDSQDWRFEKIHFEDWDKPSTVFNYLLTDSKNNIWIATNYSIYLMTPTGVIQKVNESGGNSVFEEKNGTVWVDSGGNDFGIRIYKYQNGNSIPNLVRTYTKADGFSGNQFTNAIVEISDGNILVTSNGKLYRFAPNAQNGKPQFQPLENESKTSATDKSGNIWLTVPNKGFARYLPNNFYTFSEQEGKIESGISKIFGNRYGNVYFVIGKQHLGQINDGKIEILKPFGLTYRDWIDTSLDLESKDGELWIPSQKGLLRYPKLKKFADLAHTPPKKIYTSADGLFYDTVAALFEDSRGDIWFSVTTSENTLLRWEKSTEKIYRYTTEDGLPKNNAPVSFGEDNAGNIWLGYYSGQIYRFKDGKFRDFTKEGLITRNFVTKFLTDSKGNLWFSTNSRGVFRVDHPNAENPVFTSISTANGLSSNLAYCLTEDKFGKIYITTGRGINRLDTETGRIKIFTPNDGLPGSLISKCYTDANGNIWFSYSKSLIKFVPEEDIPSKPPPIFIEGISVNGKHQAVSELGEKEINNLEFASDERQIQISFFSISFASGETLRYEYKLGDQDWVSLNEQRTVDFNLSPGTYNFSVRAITADGILSENSATVSFTIARPIWQRRWFIALSILLIGAAIFALDRYRVHKTRQIEKALDETRRANVLIRESEIRFRTLADTASDAILTIDADSNIIFVNEAIEKVFGYSPQELIGKPMTILMPERMRSGHDEGLSRYISTNQKNINWEGVSLPGLHKNGHEIPLEVSFGEFEREGKRYFTGIARDVSERKRAEEELQKAREEKFKELQRVRTRIATDLHDDIGSSLTQIAVLTEVARGQAIHIEEKNLTVPLERIKGVSKELVSVMSDIVWAINPAKDNLPDLLQRMRRFGSDIFSGKGIKFEFYTPEMEKDPTLGANIRRELFAIFKEAVNNSAKYSECNEAKVSFQIEDNWINLKIEDNGKGFDTKEVLSENFRPEMGGNGLINIQRRAKDLGGTCRITSEIGKGTRIELKIPLHLPEINA